MAASCKATPIFLRTAEGCLAISKPATRAVPLDGFKSVVSIRTAVDFPAPLGPRNPKTSPLATERLIESTATREPNERDNSSASIGALKLTP